MIARSLAAAAALGLAAPVAAQIESTLEVETLIVGGGREIALYAAAPRACAELCLREDRCGFWTYTADAFACRLYEGKPTARHIGGLFRPFTSGEVKKR